MSVSDVKDQYQDLFAITEAARTNQNRATDEDSEANGENGDNAVLETRFSELLRGRLSSNIVFTRLDQTLNLPQRVVGERDQSAVVDRRDELPSNDDVDQFDPTDSLEDPTRTAPVVHNDAPIEQPTQIRSDGAPRAEAAVAREDGRGQAQATNTAADRAAQRSVASQTMQAEEVPEELAELARNAAKNGDKKLNATVTNEQARIASAPQTTLSARAAVDAATGTRRGAAAEFQAQAVADGEELTAAEEGANNIFNRIKAQAAGGANAGRANGNAQGADPNGTGAGNAQANANPNTQFAANLTRVSTGAVTSSLTGTAQSGVTVDGASGATATLGQNNSIQNRSAPAPTAMANRPPPVPAHVVADQVAVNIQKGVAQGQDKITVNLRPQELGRVEIKMEMGHDGKLTAVVAAERPETLDMLRQDSRSLIQSLGEAGLQADENSLSFTLQGENAGTGEQQASGGGNAGGDAEDDLSEKLIETGFVFEETGGFDSDGRLDVKI